LNIKLFNFLFWSFSGYKLLRQAADLGHIGAKEELAFAHLIGIHLPMNFNQSKIYFDEGVQTGSAQSHFVRS
jgi:TPR repeat protein